MSDRDPSFGGTLTGGIQDISALLPLLGTEQCERHTGSALDGGFVYAAATPLSIFGSLGIAKTGASVLISSISIPRPSLSFKPLERSKKRFLGARLLNNAGFRLIGSVAPLVGMFEQPDEGRFPADPAATSSNRRHDKRYNAETRLLEILEEKHIDDPERVFIEWESVKWNIGLLICTSLATFLSMAPYVHLIIRGHPKVSTWPWLFPILRSFGSGVAVVCCQLIIQHRVVSLMKKRVMFMTLNRKISGYLKDEDRKRFIWNTRLSAEECLWSLEKYLYQKCSPRADDPEKQNILSTETTGHTDTPVVHPPPKDLLDLLRKQYQKHFPHATYRRIYILVTWILLLLSLPSIIAGYVGCFTLVNGSSTAGAPFVWLGLEAVFSVLRIMLWAWNPSFDEKTEVRIRLTLSEHPPLVTTETDSDFLTSDGGILDLVPQREFLERITPYTGPIEQFQCPENTVLYFTLSGTRDSELKEKRIFMTSFDLSRRTGVTLYWDGNELVYRDTEATFNTATDEMEARMKARMEETHHRRKNQPEFFQKFTAYYSLLLSALFKPPKEGVAKLPWKWTLQPDLVDLSVSDVDIKSVRVSPPLSELDRMYLELGYEQRVRTRLADAWRVSMISMMEAVRINIQYERYSLLSDPAGNTAWDLDDLNNQLVAEWTTCEFILLMLSHTLEKTLASGVEEYINLAREHMDEEMVDWVKEAFAIAKEKRLQQVKDQAWRRIGDIRDAEIQLAEKEERRGHAIRVTWDDNQDYIVSKVTEELLEETIESSELFASSSFGDSIWRDQDSPSMPNHRKLLFNLLWHRIEDAIRKMNDTPVGDLVTDPDPTEPFSTYGLRSKFFQASTLKDLLTEQRGLILEELPVDVQDLHSLGSDEVHDVVQKSKARSWINAGQLRPDNNEHLLYFSRSGGREVLLPFIQRNRTTWWLKAIGAEINSSTFYFTPHEIEPNSEYVRGYGGPIAHISVFLHSRARIRLRLVHCRSGVTSITVQKNFAELRSLETGKISEERLWYRDVELDYFEPGNHELALVVNGSRSTRSQLSTDASYGLRDVRVSFVTDDSEAAEQSLISWNTEDGRIGDDPRQIGEIIHLDVVNITSASSHPDLPEDFRVGIQIIINQEVTYATQYVRTMEKRGNCWPLVVDHNLPKNVQSFTVAVLREDSHGVHRLLGTAYIVLPRKETPIALTKVNDDGPDLYVTVAYSEHDSVHAMAMEPEQSSESEKQTIMTDNDGSEDIFEYKQYHLDARLQSIQSELLEMYNSPVFELRFHLHKIARMYERLLLLPTHQRVRAMLLNILGDICSTIVDDVSGVNQLHWARSIYGDAVRDARSHNYFEPIYWGNLTATLLRRFKTSGILDCNEAQRLVELLDHAITHTPHWHTSKDLLIERFSMLFLDSNCFEQHDRNEVLRSVNENAVGLLLAVWDGKDDALLDRLTAKYTVYHDIALVIAAAKDHSHLIRRLLLIEGLNVNLRTIEGETVLILAVRIGDDNLVEYLCTTYDLDVNIRANTGESALTLAVRHGHESIVRYLCNCPGLDINQRTDDVETPLILALRMRLGNIATALCGVTGLDPNYCADDEETALTIAVRIEDSSVVEELCKIWGLDPNHIARDGETALTLAIKNENESIVKELCKLWNLDPNIHIRDGCTALTLAVRGGNEAIIRMLLEVEKTDVNVPAKSGETALSLAKANGREEIVRLLLERMHSDSASVIGFTSAVDVDSH